MTTTEHTSAKYHSFNIEAAESKETAQPANDNHHISYYRHFTYFLAHQEVIVALVYPLLAIRKQQRLKNHQPIRLDAPTRLYGTSSLPMVMVSLVEGASHITEGLWPLTFYILLFHDLITYQSAPNDRYGTTLPDIYLTTADNQLAWASIYGTDTPYDTLHWVVPTMTGVAITLSSLLQTGYDYFLKNPAFFSDPTEIKLRAIRKAFFWGNHDRHELLQQIITISRGPSFIQRLRALSLLEEIASRYKPTHSTGDDNDYDEHETNPEAIYQMAKRALFQAQADHSRSRIENTFANYLIWSLGESLSKRNELFWLPFLLFSGAILYAKAQLIKMWSQHAKQLDQYIKDKNQCERDNKLFVWQPEIGNMQCGVCAGWNFIPYQDQDDPQKCLTGLLATVSDVSTLIAGLKQLTAHSNISAIDLSKQYWLGWSLDEWDAFWDQMDALPITHLNSINLSQPGFEVISPDSEKMLRINQFLQRVNISHIDLHNLGLEITELTTLLPGLCTVNGSINLAYNNLGKDNDRSLSTLVLQGTFRNINLADNQLANSDTIAILQAITVRAHSTVPVYSIDISQNPLSDDAFQAIATAVSIGALGEIKLAGIPFSANSSNTFASGLSDSNTLVSLDISQTALDDDNLVTLINSLPTSLRRLDLSDNPFSDDGVLNAEAGFFNTSLDALIIKNVRLTATSFNIFANLSLSVLDVTGNELTTETIHALTHGELIRTLKILIATNTQLSDINFSLLLGNFIANNALLTTLDISDNELSPDCASSIPLLAQLPLKTLVMRNNALTSAVTLPLIEAASNTTLSTIDIANTQSTATVLQRVMTPQYSFLSFFNFSQNTINDAALCEAAKQLMSPIPNNQILGDASLPRDFARELHRANAVPSLNALDIGSTGISSQGKQCLTRVWPKGTRQSESLYFSASNSQPFAIQNTLTQRSFNASTSTLSAGLLTLVPSVFLVFILYCLYSRCKQTPKPFNDNRCSPRMFNALKPSSTSIASHGATATSQSLTTRTAFN